MITLLDLSTHNGLSNLFGSGTTFTNVDGNGTDVTMQGSVTEGTISGVILQDGNTIQVTAGKNADPKVEYSIAITFASPFANFGFVSRDVTNQELLILDLTSNGSGNWTENFTQSGTYGTLSGLGTPFVTGSGDNGGNPVNSVTVTDTDVSSLVYSYRHFSGNDLDEGFSLAAVVIPEPGSLVLYGVALSACGLLLWKRKKPARP